PLNEGQNDYLYNVVQGGYYGHPNPSRYEYVLNGGNPTSSTDPEQVTSYPVGTLPDRNYRGAAFDFGGKRSPNGVIEYKSNAFGGALAGKLLVVRYSGGDDIIILTPDANGNIVASQTGAPGMTAFNNPLDLIEDTLNGNLYVAELGGSQITLLRPVGGGGSTPTVPATPTNVVASVVTATKTRITWSAVTGATLYRIQRKAPGQGSFSDYATTAATTFDDAAVLAQSTYVYRVRAENTAGPSAYSSEASVTTPAIGSWSTGVPLPFAMAELGGAIINGKMYVAGEGNPNTWEFDFTAQQWTSRAVRPFTGDNSEAEHATETVGGLLYLIGGLTGGSENKVQIFDPASNSWSLGAQRSYNAGSSLSAVIGNEIYVTGGAVTVPSYQPVGKTSKYNPATNTWTALADMALPRHSAAGGTDGQKLYIFGGRNAGLEASDGTDTVQIYDPVNNTWQTSEQPGSVIPRMPRPMRGAGIKAIFYGGEFYVIGGENSTGGFGATSNNVFDRVDIYNPTLRTWRVGPPMPTARHATIPILHQDKIYVVGGGVVRGTSFSTIVEVLDLLSGTPTPTAPSAPIGLSASAASSSQINLTWTDTSSNESGFKIERRLGSAGAWQEIATVGAGVTSYANTGLAADTQYDYQVRATNSVGDSAYSNTASATTFSVPTIPTAPSGLAASAASASQINLTWTDASNNETGFKIERRLGSAGAWQEIVTVAAGVTSYASIGLAASTEYFYQVRATNAAGDSGYSNTASATTLTAPAPGAFTSADIGNPKPAGSTTVVTEGRDYDVTVGGANIWRGSDEFRFVYQSRTGDFDVRVRLASLTAPDPQGMAGLMARATLAANSANAIVKARPGSEGYRFTYRPTAGATSIGTGSGAVAYPNTWLRLVRAGNTFTGYRSVDGVTWNVVGAVNLALPQTLFLGMAVSAKSTTATATAQFRDFDPGPVVRGSVLAATASASFSTTKISGSISGPISGAISTSLAQQLLGNDDGVRDDLPIPGH
ncbi:MAG: fibronectin type III domain-containing protein, partial [Tepidisphaeraceae bacterium]